MINMPRLNMDQMEIYEGEALYYHSRDCPSFCDFACNGNQGNLIALAYNDGVKAAQQCVSKWVSDNLEERYFNEKTNRNPG